MSNYNILQLIKFVCDLVIPFKFFIILFQNPNDHASLLKETDLSKSFFWSFTFEFPSDLFPFYSNSGSQINPQGY